MDLLRSNLPRETINLIILALNTAAKRRLRSTNKYWHQLIAIDEFTIYFARPKTLPDIVQHFARVYGDKPLGLSFEKLVACDTESFPARELVQLTQLTSLSLGFKKGLSFLAEKYELLTSLSNLISLVPCDINGGFPHLTHLYLGHGKSLGVLPSYSSLRQLEIFLPTYVGNPFALIANPTRLTKLKIYGDINQLQLPENIASGLINFHNLKTVKLRQTSDAPLPRLFQHLTNLDKLEITSAQVDMWQLTRLTSLAILTLRNTVHESLPLLHNLRSLKISQQTNNEHHSFLSALTALEHLVFYYTDHPTLTDGLKYLRSRHLTQLDVSTAENFVVDSISHLVTLERLKATEVDENRIPKSYDGLSSLVHLTKLNFVTQTPDSIRLTVLNSLTGLKELYLDSTHFNDQIHTSQNLTLSSLTNLDKLTLNCSATTYNSLAVMTRLTWLYLSVTPEVFDQDQSTLQNLASLKHLEFSDPVNSVAIWGLITTLTALDSLVVWNVDSDDVIASFSVLTNLTRLVMKRSHQVEGIHVTKLTSLQQLSLTSRQAHKLKIFQNPEMLSEKLTRLVDLSVRLRRSNRLRQLQNERRLQRKNADGMRTNNDIIASLERKVDLICGDEYEHKKFPPAREAHTIVCNGANSTITLL